MIQRSPAAWSRRLSGAHSATEARRATSAPHLSSGNCFLPNPARPFARHQRTDELATNQPDPGIRLLQAIRKRVVELTHQPAPSQMTHVLQYSRSSSQQIARLRLVQLVLVCRRRGDWQVDSCCPASVKLRIKLRRRCTKVNKRSAVSELRAVATGQRFNLRILALYPRLSIWPVATAPGSDTGEALFVQINKKQAKSFCLTLRFFAKQRCAKSFQRQSVGIPTGFPSASPKVLPTRCEQNPCQVCRRAHKYASRKSPAAPESG